MTVPSSLVVIVPSPSLSKRENASLNSKMKVYWLVVVVSFIFAPPTRQRIR